MIVAGALGMGAAVSSHLDPICGLICRVDVCGSTVVNRIQRMIQSNVRHVCKFCIHV